MDAPVEFSYTTYFAVVFLAFLSGLTTLAGVTLAIWMGENINAIAIGIGFSTGIMILISLCELVPESLHALGPIRTSVTFSLGAFLIMVLHIIIPHTHLLEKQGLQNPRQLTSAYLVVFGLILHDFPEGFALANSYLAAPTMGLLVALAIALHNVPEEFAMAVPLVALKRKKVLFQAAILSGLAEPAGAIIGLLAVQRNPELNSSFMAFAAGAMVIVSLFELIPMANRYGNMRKFALGSGLSVVVYTPLSLLLSH